MATKSDFHRIQQIRKVIPILARSWAVSFLVLTVAAFDIDPVEIGRFPLSSNTSLSVCSVVGERLYSLRTVGNSERAMVVLDISTPSLPRIVSETFFDFWPRNLAVHDRYAYVATDSDEIKVLDISEATTPELVQTLMMEQPSWLAVESGYLLAANNSALKIFSLGDPRDPQEVGEYYSFGAISQCLVSGRKCFVSPTLIVDFSDASSPRAITNVWRWQGGYSLGSPEMMGNEFGFFVSILGGGEQQIRVVDLRDPSNVIHRTSILLRESATLFYDMSRVFIGETGVALRIFDLRPLANPQRQSGKLLEERMFSEANEENGRIYLQNGDRLKLETFERKGGELTKLGEIESEMGAMAVEGDYVYRAGWIYGLQIIDFRIPESPKVVGTFMTQEFCETMRIRDGYAYLAADSSGLDIIDVNDKNNPFRVARFSTEGEAAGLDFSGEYMFVANGRKGLRIFEMSGKTNLTFIGECATKGFADVVTVVGQRAFLSDRREGLHVIDVTDRTNPRIVETYDTRGIPTRIVQDGDLLYVAASEGGVHVFDLRAGERLNRIGGNGTAANTLTIVGDSILISGYYGVSFLDHYKPFSLDIVAADSPARLLKMQGPRLPIAVQQSVDLRAWQSLTMT